MKYKYPLILMFQPISHQRSCLLLAEAGPESHLFYLSRRSKLERHQKAGGREKSSGMEALRQLVCYHRLSKTKRYTNLFSRLIRFQKERNQMLACLSFYIKVLKRGRTRTMIVQSTPRFFKNYFVLGMSVGWFLTLTLPPFSTLL